MRLIALALAGVTQCWGGALIAYAQSAGVEPGCYQIAIARGQSEIATDRAKCDQAYRAGQDEWCAHATSPARKAVCADPELRALALERNKAYYDALARLDSGASAALFDNQTTWGGSYALACGITPKFAPTFPLPPQIKKCMARAGRARLAYLRGYRGATSNPSVAPDPTISTDYRSMLIAWFEAHKRYPESARIRSEEGRALLRFRVDRSGRVLDYGVVSSTGYPDLDASIEAMMRDATLPPFPAEMTVPEIEALVTVSFGLEAGQPSRAPAPQTGPAAPNVRTGPARNLVDVLGPDPSDRTCQDFWGPNASPVGSPHWLECKASDDAMDARAQAVWDRWTPDQRAAFLNYLHAAIDADPRDRDWTPTGAASRTDYGLAAKYAEIAACGAPIPNTSCPQ